MIYQTVNGLFNKDLPVVFHNFCFFNGRSRQLHFSLCITKINKVFAFFPLQGQEEFFPLWI